MKLEQLLERLEYTCVQGSLDREISGIANDSRQVVPGTLFFSQLLNVLFCSGKDLVSFSYIKI